MSKRVDGAYQLGKAILEAVKGLDGQMELEGTSIKQCPENRMKNDQLLRDLFAWATKHPWTGLGDAKGYTDGKDLLTRLRRAVNETDLKTPKKHE